MNILTWNQREKKKTKNDKKKVIFINDRSYGVKQSEDLLAGIQQVKLAVKSIC